MIFEKNISLQSFNTFGINVHALLFVSITSLSELKDAINLAKSYRYKILFLGGGSNILLTQNFEGLVIHINLKGKSIVSETKTHIIVQAQSGENWHEFVLYCIENNWGGIENLSLIPGNVGTAPMQNIGAYGVELKDVFYSLKALDINTLTVKSFSKEECGFGYRESVFKNKLKGRYVIIEVYFLLTKNHHTLNTAYGDIKTELNKMECVNPSIKNINKAIVAIRQSKLPDPKIIGNAGSFFKNPIINKELFLTIQTLYPNIPFFRIDENTVKIPAAWLVETLGFKGLTIDNIGVHKNQALVLVNYGGGKGKDILALSQKIIDAVYNEFNIKLEREVNVM